MLKFFTASKPKFWFSLSLTLGFIYALMALQKAFSGEYVVQDDARQHVFWMVRFIDPELFPNDLIADYFQSVAPAGYKAVYQLPARLGINPLVLNKFLPILLGLITTGYCFAISMQLLPIPATALISTLLLNQNLWMKDDIVSATPRGFVYPIFLGFLYYLLRRNLWGVGIAIALLGLFYPQCVFIASGILILRLFRWQNWRFKLSPNRTDWILCASGLGVAFLVLLPFALSSSQFGPTITASAARKLPEFLPGGRANFFHRDLFKFIFTGYRSGMFPRSLFTPVTLLFGLLLPILVRFRSRFPLLKQLTNSSAILGQIVIASIGMFFAAHAVLFKLHLPSRYTGITFRIVIAFASAIAISIILDTIWRWAIGNNSVGAGFTNNFSPEQITLKNPPPPVEPGFTNNFSPEQITLKNPPPSLARGKNIVAIVATLVISIALIGYPSFVEEFPRTAYRTGELPKLYEFFQQTPKDSLIASVAEEANYIPSFSQRSILAGSEYAIPYQVGYYRQFRQRFLDLIRAQYSPNLAEVQNFIRQYKIDFWLLDPGGLTKEYLANHRRVQQYQPAAKEALDKLQKGAIPALTKVMATCQVFEDKGFVVLDANCINSKVR
ncbi:MAG TPA: hypothetical protein DD990_21580 [Cyanobacteria bacterium UBA11368]|nr:hypothetical protein [Cyanobacteria bacterium UBA11368]